jgi:hypothetical protein
VIAGIDGNKKEKLLTFAHEESGSRIELSDVRRYVIAGRHALL